MGILERVATGACLGEPVEEQGGHITTECEPSAIDLGEPWKSRGTYHNRVWGPVPQRAATGLTGTRGTLRRAYI